MCGGCDGTGLKTDRLFVPFRNPLDGGTPYSNHALWDRVGETLAALTITPSIDASRAHQGGWHGRVTNGLIT